MVNPSYKSVANKNRPQEPKESMDEGVNGDLIQMFQLYINCIVSMQKK